MTKAISIGITAIILILVALFVWTNTAQATGQETCPQDALWVKIEDIDEQSYTYTAPEGFEVEESCYKAGTTLRFETYDPTQEEVTVTSNVWNNAICNIFPSFPGCNYRDISHASFKLVEIEEPVEVCEDEEATNFGKEEECVYPEPDEEATPSATPTPKVTALPNTGTDYDFLFGLVTGIVGLAVVISLYQWTKK